VKAPGWSPGAFSFSARGSGLSLEIDRHLRRTSHVVVRARVVVLRTNGPRRVRPAAQNFTNFPTFRGVQSVS